MTLQAERRPTSRPVSVYARAGAIGGLVFVVGLLASIAVVPSGPKADASADEVATYFVDERSAVLLSGFLTGIAALGYLIWIAALRARIQDADPEERVLPGAIGIASAVQVAMVVLSSVCFWALAGRVAAEADPGVSLGLFVLGMKVYSALDLAAPVVFAAIGLAVLHTGVFARWLGVFMLVLAVPAAGLGLIGPLVSDGPFAPQGPVDMVATTGFLLWIAVTSVVMLRDGRSAAPS